MFLQKLLTKISNGKKGRAQSRKTVAQDIHADFISEGEDAMRTIYFKMVQLVDTEMMFLDPHLTITKLADIVGTNTNYITKVIQQYTAEDGFCDYINRKRINYAKSMLKSKTHLTVQTIALKSGYSSASAFQYNFRKFEDKSPGQWRFNYFSASSTALKYR